MTAAGSSPADLEAAELEAAEYRRGVWLTVGAYLAWGSMPLYFSLLAPAGALEVVAHRVLWSLLVCLALAWLLGRRRRARGGLAAGRTVAALGRRRLGLLGLAGLLVATNWVLYVLAVLTGHVVEAALGYFINPVLSVALGVIFLRERLSAARWTAVGISVLAVVVLAVGYGRPPWLALGLAFSFGLYGLVKKKVAADAVTSLTVETAWLTPLAIGFLVWLGPGNTFAAEGGAHALLLVSAGLVTTVPLLLFGAGARRIPLSMVGLLQNLTPVLQFLVGVLVFAEQMPPARLLGFALVWLALLVLMADLLLRGRRGRRAATAAGRSAPRDAGPPTAAPTPRR